MKFFETRQMIEARGSKYARELLKWAGLTLGERCFFEFVEVWHEVEFAVGGDEL